MGYDLPMEDVRVLIDSNAYFRLMQNDDDAACCRNDADYDWGTDGDRVRLFFTLILHTTVFMGLLDSRKTTKRKILTLRTANTP